MSHSPRSRISFSRHISPCDNCSAAPDAPDAADVSGRRRFRPPLVGTNPLHVHTSWRQLRHDDPPSLLTCSPRPPPRLGPPPSPPPSGERGEGWGKASEDSPPDVRLPPSPEVDIGRSLWCAYLQRSETCFVFKHASS